MSSLSMGPKNDIGAFQQAWHDFNANFNPFSNEFRQRIIDTNEAEKKALARAGADAEDDKLVVMDQKAQKYSDEIGKNEARKESILDQMIEAREKGDTAQLVALQNKYLKLEIRGAALSAGHETLTLKVAEVESDKIIEDTVVLVAELEDASATKHAATNPDQLQSTISEGAKNRGKMRSTFAEILEGIQGKQRGQTDDVIGQPLGSSIKPEMDKVLRQHQEKREKEAEQKALKAAETARSQMDGIDLLNYTSDQYRIPARS